MALLFAGRVAEAKQEMEKLSEAARTQNLLNRWIAATSALKEGDAAPAQSEFNTRASRRGNGRGTPRLRDTGSCRATTWSPAPKDQRPSAQSPI
jgi:hypothetical protein